MQIRRVVLSFDFLPLLEPASASKFILIWISMRSCTRVSIQQRAIGIIRLGDFDTPTNWSRRVYFFKNNLRPFSPKKKASWIFSILNNHSKSGIKIYNFFFYERQIQFFLFLSDYFRAYNDLLFPLWLKIIFLWSKNSKLREKREIFFLLKKRGYLAHFNLFKNHNSNKFHSIQLVIYSITQNKKNVFHIKWRIIALVWTTMVEIRKERN